MDAFSLVLALLSVPSPAGADLSRFPGPVECETALKIYDAVICGYEKKQRETCSIYWDGEWHIFISRIKARRKCWECLQWAHRSEAPGCDYRYWDRNYSSTAEFLGTLEEMLGTERYYIGAMPQPGW